MDRLKIILLALMAVLAVALFGLTLLRLYMEAVKSWHQGKGLFADLARRVLNGGC